jgi:pimeloyl-ACP methyl ester carboxylesterase
VDAWVVGPDRDPSDVDPAVVDAVRMMQRRAFEVSASWPSDLPEAELEPPALERLPEITARALVLVGGHDLDTTHDAAARVVSGIPGARRIDWPDVAHLPSMERPQECSDLMLDWTAEELHPLGRTSG